MYDAFVARLRADSGMAVEYERSGTLQVALDETEATRLQASAAELAASHIPHSWLNPRHASRVEPHLSSSIAGALFIPEHGYVAVTALVQALAEAAGRRGVRFTRGRLVELRGGTPVQVVTTEGTIETDVVVVAAGSWSSDAATSRLRPAVVKPIRGQLLHLRTPTRAASRVVWGDECYIVPWQDGTVLVGATVEDVGFDERATVRGVRQLLDAALRLLPSLDAAAFEGVRVGLRPMTQDELPVIGSSTRVDGVIYATGHYRNGILLAPLTAALVGDLVLENHARTELSLTRPDRLGL
jgi:glycine oxidase